MANFNDIRQKTIDVIHDNENGEITSEKLRELQLDIIDSINLEKQDVIPNVDLLIQNAENAYQKPEGGIPLDDFTEEVLDAIEKAGSSISYLELDLTNAQRIQALANISNQLTGYDESDPPVFTGKMGYKVLQPQVNDDLNSTFAEQIKGFPNTIFEIRDVFDLDDNSVTIPANCTLKFSGGMLKNGTLIGNNTKIDAGDEQIFDTLVSLEDNWITDGISITNFGAKTVGYTNNKFNTDHDSTGAIQAALNTKLPVIVPQGNFLITSTITIPANSRIIGVADALVGLDANYSSNNRHNNKPSRFIIDDVSGFDEQEYENEILGNGILTNKIVFNIEGTSSVENILVDAMQSVTSENEYIVIFNFDSEYANSNSIYNNYIYGKRDVPYNVIAYKFDMDKDVVNPKGYLTATKIDGLAANCFVGVHIPKHEKYEPNPSMRRWITSIYLNISINRAYYNHVLESGGVYTINGVQQCSHCYDLNDYTTIENRPIQNKDPNNPNDLNVINAAIDQMNIAREEHGAMTYINGATNITFGENCFYWDVDVNPNKKTSSDTIPCLYPQKYALIIKNQEGLKDTCEYSNDICSIYVNDSIRSGFYNQTKIIGTEVQFSNLREVKQPILNPISGIDLPIPFDSQNFANNTHLSVRFNNVLYPYSLHSNGTYTPTIGLYSSEDELKQSIDKYDQLSGEPNYLNITASDGDYIRYDFKNATAFNGCFIIQQLLTYSLSIYKVKLYNRGAANNMNLVDEGEGKNLMYEEDCFVNYATPNMVHYFTVSGLNYLSVKLYIKNNSNQNLTAGIRYALSIVRSEDNGRCLLSDVRNISKVNNIRYLYSLGNPLRCVTTYTNGGSSSEVTSVFLRSAIGTTADITKKIGSSPQWGELFFDTQKGKVLFYDASPQAKVWIDYNGFTALNKKGRTATRPKTTGSDDYHLSLTTKRDEGYRYFDTDLKKYIMWVPDYDAGGNIDQTSPGNWYNLDGTPLTTFTIDKTTNVGQNVTITDNSINDAIDANRTYLATVEADSGYTLDSIIVEMNGIDVTSFVYNNGVIYIAGVTGNIVITATATHNP